MSLVSGNVTALYHFIFLRNLRNNLIEKGYADKNKGNDIINLLQI